jgi:hypothetical protein
VSGAAARAAPVPTPEARGTPLPPDLARKVAEAYGGAAALARVAAVRQTGKVAAVAQGGKTGALSRLLARPDSLRVEITYPGGPTELRVHHAGRGVRDGRNVTGTVPHHAMALQAARLALPLWIASAERDVRYVGRREREARELEVVAVALPSGLALEAEIDPASGRIVRTIGTIPGPGEQALEFVNTYSEFRSAGGITFAFREENFARGVHTGDTVLERVEVLTTVPAGAFEAPSSEASNVDAGARL